MYDKFCKMPYNEEEYNSIELNEFNLAPIYSDLNTTSYIAQINGLYSRKEYSLARKMLNLIGVELPK